MAPTKEAEKDAERKEALRVDQQSTALDAHTTYVGPDLSFTEGHGDPPFPEDAEPEVDGQKLGPRAVREPTESYPKTREENIEERNEEVEKAVEGEKEEAERRNKIREEEAEAHAEQVKQDRAIKTAIGSLVGSASRPTPAVKKEETKETKSGS